MSQNKNFSYKAFKKLVRAGIFEILREPKLFFFIIIFPLLFMFLFWGMSHMIPSSEEMGMDFFQFMFPGLLIFALMSICLLGTASPIIEMRQKGTLRLFQLSPLSSMTFIISQITIRFLLALLQVSLFLLIGFLLEYITLSNIIPLLLVSILGMTFMLIMGFMLGGLFNSSEMSSGIISGLSAPLLMLSGVLMPYTIMPDVIKDIGKFIPFTYLGDATRQVMFSNYSGSFDLLVNISVLVGFSLIIFIISIKTFKWNLEKM